ncbi:MAG: hypothetical protein WDA74_06190 [Spirochaetota bacterium]
MIKKIKLIDRGLQGDLIDAMTSIHQGVVLQGVTWCFCIGASYDEEGKREFRFGIIIIRVEKSALFCGTRKTYEYLDIPEFMRHQSWLDDREGTV